MALGFGGRWPAWSRQLGEVLHFVEFQKARGEPFLWINLGVHLTFVPTCVPTKGQLREIDRELRGRVCDEAGEDLSFPCGPHAASSVQLAWRGLETRGLPI